MPHLSFSGLQCQLRERSASGIVFLGALANQYKLFSVTQGHSSERLEGQFDGHFLESYLVVVHRQVYLTDLR